MKRGETDAATCAANGWTVGTRLAGDNGYGPTVIRITAIGEERILARRLTALVDAGPEVAWTLRYRDWAPVGGAT
jgi:hypothetical protein